MEILQLIMLAFVVEATWETSKMVWDNNKVSVDRIGALIIGLAVTLVYQVDLLATLEITPQSNILGVILTGILISRGGNYVHDLVGSLKANQNE